MVSLNQSTDSFLSVEQVQSYWNDGVVYPLTAISEREATDLIPRFTELRDRMVGWVNCKQLLKVHLVSRWVYDLASSKRVLDAVEGVLGPNILLWGATFFAKKPNHTFHVGWHQDLLYWGLKPADGVLTVWLGLTDASSDNGAMQVIRGSHTDGIRNHDNHFDANNMLMSSQNCEPTEEDWQNRITCELRPGQFSIHHGMALHGSGPNLSDRPRIGLSINYISTEVVQQRNAGRDTAMLVRGVDHYGHFELESPPESDFSEAAINQYRKSIVAPSGLATLDDVPTSLVNLERIV